MGFYCVTAGSQRASGRTAPHDFVSAGTLLWVATIAEPPIALVVGPGISQNPVCKRPDLMVLSHGVGGGLETWLLRYARSWGIRVLVAHANSQTHHRPG